MVLHEPKELPGLIFPVTVKDKIIFTWAFPLLSGASPTIISKPLLSWMADGAAPWVTERVLR
jgi:hypothetical protein